MWRQHVNAPWTASPPLIVAPASTWAIAWTCMSGVKKSETSASWAPAIGCSTNRPVSRSFANWP